MFFSIIVPTCNRNDLLKKCLEQLQPSNQNFNAHGYEVIVSDDSEDGLARTLIQTQFPFVKWIEGPKKGPAANRNNGAGFAKGDWLIFIDDDCLPGKNLINSYKNAIIINPETKVFEGCIKADRNKSSFIEESPVNENGDKLWSCNFMISAILFRMLNGFDPAFPYPAMEDVDFQYRIKKLNEKIEFVQQAYVIHPWRIEKNILFKTKRRFQSTLYFLKKHPEMTSKINSFYFFRSSMINFRNGFKYASAFKFKGIEKQFLLSFLHLYYAAFLLFKKHRFQNK